MYTKMMKKKSWEYFLNGDAWFFVPNLFELNSESSMHASDVCVAYQIKE